MGKPSCGITRSAAQHRTTLSRAQERKHPHRATRHDRKDLAPDGGIVTRLFHGVADHHAALIRLPHGMDDVGQERRDLLGDHDLPALRAHRSMQRKHRGKPRIAEPGGEHHACSSDLARCGVQAKFIRAWLDPGDAMVGAIGAAQALESEVKGIEKAQRVDVAVLGTEACPDDLGPDLRQHLRDLRVVHDLTIEVLHSGLVVQTPQRIGAIFQLALGEKKMQPAGLAEADIDACLLLDGLGELRP